MKTIKMLSRKEEAKLIKDYQSTPDGHLKNRKFEALWQQYWPFTNSFLNKRKVIREKIVGRDYEDEIQETKLIFERSLMSFNPKKARFVTHYALALRNGFCEMDYKSKPVQFPTSMKFKKSYYMIARIIRDNPECSPEEIFEIVKETVVNELEMDESNTVKLFNVMTRKGVLDLDRTFLTETEESDPPALTENIENPHNINQDDCLFHGKEIPELFWRTCKEVLTKEQYNIIKSVYFDNIAIKDIAKEKGVSYQRVHQIITHAKSIMKKNGVFQEIAEHF